MAANLFDHPYAAAVNNNDSNVDENSESETNFKDSPRKVLVQENKGATLSILNEIAHNEDFSCLDVVKHDLNENGLHIESAASSSDDMEMHINTEEKKEVKGIDSSETTNTQDIDKSETSDTKPSNVLDVFLGIKSVFDIKVSELKSDKYAIKQKHDTDIGTKEGKIEAKKRTEGADPNGIDNSGDVPDIDTKEDTFNDGIKGTCPNEMENSEDVPVISNNGVCTEEMDTSTNDVDEETDDADEGELDNSLENSSELTSEIKAGVGNGIIVSVMKKKIGRRKKRKNSCWSKPNPCKIRRLNSSSPRSGSIETASPVKKSVEEQILPKDTVDIVDGDLKKDGEASEYNMAVNMITSADYAAQTEEEKEGTSKGETSQSDGQEYMDDRLRRRSRTPGNKEGYLLGDEAILNEMVKLEEAIDLDKSFPRKKSLLFHKGKKASPGQIKPLTAEETEKYKQPFKYGWKRELVFRGAYCESSVKTQADTYYFPPSKGPKLRSMVQIADWVATHDTPLTTDNFTFMRRAIGADGEMVRNAAQNRGKASVEAAQKKRVQKMENDEHVHDDNDGQYDTPEVVIERDLDDFLAPIISAVLEKETTPKIELKRGRPPKNKDLINIPTVPSIANLPNLEELKDEKVEMMHPSNEHVIVSPSKKKKEHKATARKSTTQKTFRKPIPYTGIENLCSLACPGMEGIPPMLHCNVCMCLFHNECVNYFGQDEDFICLRCTDMQPPSAGGAPITTIDNNVMKVSNPMLLNQLKMTTPSPTRRTVVRVYPGLEMKSMVSPSASPALNMNFKGNLIKVATPPNSMLPLYKMLPVLSGSPRPTLAAVSTPLNYPVLLTQNTSAFKSSSPSHIPLKSLLSAVASGPTVKPTTVADLVNAYTSKSTNLNDIVNASNTKSPCVADVKPKPHQMDYPELRPLIKQEPIDDSYEDAGKSNQGEGKGVKASMEALHNLKNVLSSRLGSPPLSGERKLVNNQSKPAVTNENSFLQQSFAPGPTSFSTGPTPVRLMNNFLNTSTLSQSVNQPRMAFGMASPPQGQFPENQEYRIVPIGPPMPLNKLPMRMPLLHGQSFQSMTSTSIVPPVTQSPQISTQRQSVLVTTHDETATGASGPLVVNAKSVAPMNGQLLTLPPPVVKKLTLNKPLALKINNRQITVPPSGFFQSSEGLKVFLPPNTFPTADVNIVNVSVTNEKSHEEDSASKSDITESQKSAKSDLSPFKDKTDKTDQRVKGEARDIKRNKFYGKCCLIQRLYGGYGTMFHIFKFLDVQDLLRVSLVCKTWRMITLLPDLWSNVRFRDTRVIDWQKALKYVSQRNVQSLSLQGVSHFEEPNRTWHQLVSSLHELSILKKISFGLVPAAVLQSVAGKLTQLESFCAETISDYTDDTKWDVPTKLDVGNFRCTSELKVLKLRGTGGLSLPSFSFGCGLADIGKLSNLHTLHLTSLRNLSGSDFHFISNLTTMKELALGDCENWTQETYSHLQKLTSLLCLRLENGGDIPDAGLGLALSHLTQLESLELIKYTIAYTFGNHIGGLTKLQHVCVYPVNMHYMGEVNTNTLRAVERLKTLSTLDWVIPRSSSSSIILDDNENAEMEPVVGDHQQWIPFQTVLALQLAERSKNVAAEYTSVQQLKDKLEKALPDATVRVYSEKCEKTSL